MYKLFQKLMCKLFGHRFVYDDYGETIWTKTSPVGLSFGVNWMRLCLRCGQHKEQGGIRLNRYFRL